MLAVTTGNDRLHFMIHFSLSPHEGRLDFVGLGTIGLPNQGWTKLSMTYYRNSDLINVTIDNFFTERHYSFRTPSASEFGKDMWLGKLPRELHTEEFDGIISCLQLFMGVAIESVEDKQEYMDTCFSKNNKYCTCDVKLSMREYLIIRDE